MRIFEKLFKNQGRDLHFRIGYPLTGRVLTAIIEHPTSIIVNGPTAVIILFAEWVRGTYDKT